jgi:hypothetical protein
MSPNLHSLFAQATKPMYSTVDGVNLVDMDVKLARVRLEDLLATHGEALIKALEEAHELLYPQYYHSALEQRISALLAALEREAGGQS